MPNQRYRVGIDLGTTYSSLSYLDDDGRVITLPLANGRLAMASAVFFASRSKAIVGDRALNYRVRHPDRIARRFKREIGNPDWVFEVGSKRLRPEALSAMVLRKLLNEAAKTIGPIEEAVISVPFIFDARRRTATKNAGKIAGLKSVEIVDEPVAGALAYAHKILIEGGAAARDMTEMFGDRVILVCDLGGGTFDLTLMRIRPNYTFDVIATAGDAQLGGEDWDKVLEDVLVQHYSRYSLSNPREDASLMQSLRIKAVEAKHALSKAPRVSVGLQEGERREEVVIAAGEFQERSQFLLLRIRATLTEMLESRNLSPSGIETVIAIGGSSRMPMIGSLLREIIRRDFDQSLEPDTAVSQGAAIYAGYRAQHPKLKKVRIRTVNPHALGLVAYHRSSQKYTNDVLIRANERTLTPRKRAYPVLEGAQQVKLVVIQGELPDPHECVVLGEAVMPHFPPQALAGATVEVEFTFQENGLLHVEGRVMPSDGSLPVQVGLDIHIKGDMSDAQVTEAVDFLSGISID